MPKQNHEIHPCAKAQGILSQKDDKLWGSEHLLSLAKTNRDRYY